MRVISCVSFHGTGSGAVDDFLKEFDNCPSAPSDVECRFLQDPDGISDLEYNLIENPHRLNSGYALRRYLRFAKAMSRTYRKIFGNKWLEYSEEYIRSLVSVEYKGYWHGDILLLPQYKKYIYYFQRGINKCLPPKWRKPGYYNYFPNAYFWHTYITEEKFLKETQSYVKKLCTLLNPDGEEFVLLDQLVPTSNIRRYLKYVENIKVIVVDRDPRDLFIQQSLIGDHVLPKEPNAFARVYRDQRKMVGDYHNTDSILFIKFEDLIFKYEEMTKLIIDFVGEKEENHIHKLEKFNPKVSIQNTQMWLKHPEYAESVRIIEQELPDFLYDFKQ